MSAGRDSATKRPSVRAAHLPLHSLRLALIVLAAISILRPSRAAAAGPDPSAVNSIETFVQCLNLIKVGKGTIADAVRCVPRGCNFTVTKSFSAQASCERGGCELPRVIFNCPGPTDDLRFRPSFLLCPAGSVRAGSQLGMNRIEVGEDVNDAHDQKMADIPIPPRTTDFSTITAGNGPETVLSKTTADNVGTKECNKCHGVPPIPRAKEDADHNQLSTAIFPFAFLTLDTNEPDLVPGMPMTLEAVCDCIEANTDAIVQDLQARSEPTDAFTGRQILLQLCRRLLNRIRDVGPEVDAAPGP